jgi:predicted MFS family arabinose efflux permease
MVEHSLSVDTEADQTLSPAVVALLTVATGAFIANLYYSQPLLASIAPDIGISPSLAGAIVSVGQAGFGIGLFLLVPFADLIENKKLILAMLIGVIAALVGMAMSRGMTELFISSFILGLCASGTQVLVPFVVRLMPDDRRGHAVGTVMAGLLTGIMLARPLALTMSASFGWRSIFWMSAAFMSVVGVSLAWMMPRYLPPKSMRYDQAIASMIRLFLVTPVLRRRSFYQALMFAAFNMFWTTAPVMLGAQFGLGQYGIALFALAGAGGALAAPVAGRLADRGFVRVTTAGAMALLLLSFYFTGWAVDARLLVAVALLGILLDLAVQANQVVGQRAIFSVPTESRGRANAIYMTIVFVGGAMGSMLGTVSYHWGGWDATSYVGAALGVLMLLAFATEFVGSFRSASQR